MFVCGGGVVSGEFREGRIERGARGFVCGGVSEVGAGPRGRRWARAPAGAASSQVRSAEPTSESMRAGARRARSERCGLYGWPREARACSGCPCLPGFCIERHRPACRAEFDNPSVASHTSKIQHSPNASAHACKKGPGRLGLRRGRREAESASESHPTGPGRRRDRPTSRQAAFHPSSGGRSREACW